jgi:acetyltransferase
VNPLLVTPAGVLALDARVVLHDPATREADLPRSAIRPYPSEHVVNMVLREGTPIAIRPIRSDDEPRIAAFHRTLGEESVRLRYMGSTTVDQRTAHQRLVRVCLADFDREIALVVEPRAGADAPPGEIVAVGRLSRDRADTGDAEFALLVADSWQGRGVGRLLLGHLVEVGRREGVRSIHADILPNNLRMQRLCANLGFAVEAATTAEVVAATLVV